MTEEFHWVVGGFKQALKVGDGRGVAVVRKNDPFQNRGTNRKEVGGSIGEAAKIGHIGKISGKSGGMSPGQNG